ncbi:MAG TPA: hypothetical protein VJ183_08285 [Chloroflexia bacterium]|nr:hypothetical protein [Chloroflexia bacterium]
MASSDQAHSADEQDAAYRRAQQVNKEADNGPASRQPSSEPDYPSRLLAHPDIARRGNTRVRAAIIQRMQQNVGNRQARKAVQRDMWGPSLAERPGGFSPSQEDWLEVESKDESEDERVSSKADQAWKELYEEYPDLRPKSEMEDEEYEEDW